MLNVPKRANDAMHMSMLDGYDVSVSLLYRCVDCFLSRLINVVVDDCFRVGCTFLLGTSIDI